MILFTQSVNSRFDHLHSIGRFSRAFKTLANLANLFSFTNYEEQHFTLVDDYNLMHGSFNLLFETCRTFILATFNHTRSIDPIVHFQ